MECIVSYACYGVGNGDRGKTVAAFECIVPYACNGVGYGDRGKTEAAPECTVSYAFYGVGYGDRGKTGAAPVFATLCISIDFILNGRKVTVWIWGMVKMMGI